MSRTTTLVSLALAGLAALGGRADATEARELGFGSASAFIVDDSSYATLPQEVGTFKNSTYFELGPATNAVHATPYEPWGGVNVPLGPGTLGVWIGRDNDDFSGLYANSQLTLASLGGVSANFLAGMANLQGFGAVAGANTINSLYQDQGGTGRVDLIYDFDFSNTVNLAVGINRANTDEKVDSSGASHSSWDVDNLGLSLGADVRQLGPFNLLQVGLQVNMESQIADFTANGNDSKFDSSATGLRLRVGGETAGEGGRFGRFELGLGGGDLNVQTSPYGGTSYTDNGGVLNFNAGAALGMSRERGMGLVGLMLYGNAGGDNNTAAPGGDRTTYYNDNVVLSTAGEVKIKEWLTARAGLSGSLVNVGGTTGANGTGTSGSNSVFVAETGISGATPIPAPGTVNAAMGLSLEFGNLSLDGVLNQNLLYTGTYLLSGQSNAVFSQVSLTWRWE
jgi:hypothetical protein